MLAASIIKHGTSKLFITCSPSSKEDGSWMFCVNCRALNQLTIKDGFSIPIVDVDK